MATAFPVRHGYSHMIGNRSMVTVISRYIRVSDNMSAVFSDAEESLGTGLERQMNNLAGESSTTGLDQANRQISKRRYIPSSHSRVTQLMISRCTLSDAIYLLSSDNQKGSKRK